MGDADQISDYLSCSYNEIQSTTMKREVRMHSNHPYSASRPLCLEHETTGESGCVGLALLTLGINPRSRSLTGLGVSQSLGFLPLKVGFLDCGLQISIVHVCDLRNEPTGRNSSVENPICHFWDFLQIGMGFTPYCRARK